MFLAHDTQMYLGTYIQLYDNQEYLLITHLFDYVFWKHEQPSSKDGNEYMLR